MNITDDTNDSTVLELEHPSNCWSPSLCPWSVPTMIVRLPTGELLGQVKHTYVHSYTSSLEQSVLFDPETKTGEPNANRVTGVLIGAATENSHGRACHLNL